jgi:acyl transferase domain-containing protein
MGRELYEREAVFRQTVDQCALAFAAAQGYDLREVLYPAAGGEAAAAARLLETEVTQPALFVLEYALTRVWQAWGLRIEALMGHSLGEYVAACVAGVLSVADGVRLVGRRAHLSRGNVELRLVQRTLDAIAFEEAVGEARLFVRAVFMRRVNAPREVEQTHGLATGVHGQRAVFRDLFPCRDPDPSFAHCVRSFVSIVRPVSCGLPRTDLRS